MISAYLHELKGEFKVLHRVHFDAEELEAHDEANGGLDDVGALLLLPQLLQLGDELLPHCREPAEDTGSQKLSKQLPFFLRVYVSG